MYNHFFGFKERPFQLVPNPAYLFLSRSHEEALAHLTYAIYQGDGFVEVTGEVGTGKTTLCRVFLERLDNSTEAAYIFNPKLDSVQLLKAINDEFGINSGADNTKDLIDILNTFLMEKRAEEKKAVLIIDEAQNLTMEVLEQLRLLSNLETTRNKLIQIILVGQPELREMLDSYELRQLSQRITLNCHLAPLTYKETIDYIRHRINIASQKPGIKFTGSAFGKIYNYSGGIPRRINIVCDRALLTAYGIDQHRITSTIVNESIRELTGRGNSKHLRLYMRKSTVFLMLLLGIVVLLSISFTSGYLPLPGVKESKIRNKILPKPEKKIVAVQPHTEPVKKSDKLPPAYAMPEKELKTEILEPKALQETKIPEPVTMPDTEIQESETISEIAAQKSKQKIINAHDLEEFLQAIDYRSSRHFALKKAMDLWKSEAEIKEYFNSLDDDQAFFRLVAKQNGLSVHRIEADLNLVKNLNLPVVLELYFTGGLFPRYLTVSNICDEQVTLGSGDDPITVDTDEVRTYWTGVAYIIWKNFYSYAGLMPINSPVDSIITLKMHLRDIGFNEVEISPFYDPITRDAVKMIQEKHGIDIDGIVGPVTKIALYNEMPSLEIPHIVDENRLIDY